METRSNPVAAPAVNGQAALIELMATLSETQKDIANNNLKLTQKSAAMDVNIVNDMAQQIGNSYDAQITGLKAEANASFAAGATSLFSAGLHFKATFHDGGEDGIMSNQLKALKNEIFVTREGQPGVSELLTDDFKNALIKSNGLDVEGKALDLQKSYVVDSGKLRVASTTDIGAKKMTEILAGSDENTKLALNEALKIKIKEVEKKINHSIDRYKNGAQTSQAFGQSTSQGVSGAIRAEATATQKLADETKAKLDNAKSLTEQTQQANQAAAKDGMDKVNAALELARLAEGINSVRG